MASFEYDIPGDLLNELKKLGSAADEIAIKMLNQSAPILMDRVTAELSNHKVSGDLVKSIKIIKAKKAKGGGYSAGVEPSGTDKKGVRNVEKMIYLEYGTSRQPARPTLAKAINDSEQGVLAKMQEVFDRESSGK